MIFLVALSAGCGLGKKTLPDHTAPAEPQVVTPPPAEPLPPVAEPVEPTPAAPNREEVVAVEPTRPEAKPEAAPPTAPPPPVQPVPSKMAAEKPAVVEPLPVAPAPSSAKPEVPPAPVAKPPPPATPTLDVAALKERLKETKAIGVFTKLTLKNQVDDLLQQFQAYYQARQKHNIATLRQAYDMLVLKVLSLIQDGDPTLARTIAASREAIWNMLADPVKFKSLI